MIAKFLDNKSDKLGDELKEDLNNTSKLMICSSIFSMYGYESLKKELNKVIDFNFIFTDPTFIERKEKTKEQRIFEIENKIREKSISGSEFEVRLKNELNGKAIAKECAEWIKRKAHFKTNIGNGYMQPFISIDNKDSKISYVAGNLEFSSVGLGYENDNSIFNPINKFIDAQQSKQYINMFNQLWNNDKIMKDVTDKVIDFISDLYKENSPEFIYYITLYNIFNEFLEDISEDELANDKTGFKNSKIWNTLYDFQKDAVLGLINKLERHNGCILADSVGLGKTYTALAVMKYYQERNKSILVLCPKKLSENWNTFKGNYKDNPLHEDRFNYDVLFHTDLSRKHGSSNGIDLSRVNWGNYDLVVIDESHNFRNNDARNDRETRYTRLMNQVMKAGVRTKVLMLSATPVNNRFLDLRNQLALAYEGRTDEIDEKISSSKSIDTILKDAQTIFNEWSKCPKEERTSQELLRRLNTNFDFFKLLDSVTIARSRKHIEKYYNINDIGKFPERLKPISVSSEITELPDFMTISEIADELSKLNMSVYSPFEYILLSEIEKYEKLYDTDVSDGKAILKQIDRERSLKTLMRVNLLKRLESSVEAFRLTLRKITNYIDETIKSIDKFEEKKIGSGIEILDFDDEDDDINDDSDSIGKKVKIKLEDMNLPGWKEDLLHDYNILESLLEQMNKVTCEYDTKLNDLFGLITSKIESPINAGNKKIIIFSAFADTANYLYKQIAGNLKNHYNINTCKVTGSGENECTLEISKDFNNLLINFSPISKHRDLISDNKNEDIDILIATDCISEGQNLQDCDYLINYDIHWNPVRIIQRFGRIDRIGSKNEKIQLVNFWPNISLEDYINLKSRVENRMTMGGITATGEDILNNQMNDLEYRKNQLSKLKEEVVDLEDMGNGISLTDLGLNDFRMDLIEYIKDNDLSSVPFGLHSVVRENKNLGIEKGVIYVLKNINNEVNIDNMNQLHPFYLVYIKDDGEVISNYLNVKNTLDLLKIMSNGKKEPIKEAYNIFNELTNDGKNMNKYSNLLSQSIDSIISVKEENDINSLFKRGGTTFNNNNIKGIEDFELIAFMVIV